MKKTIRTIAVRNLLIFLALYLVSMGLLTYATRNTIAENMLRTMQVQWTDFDALFSEYAQNEAKQTADQDAYFAFLTKRFCEKAQTVYEGSYMRICLYDAAGTAVAQNGNYLWQQAAGDGGYHLVRLDEYFTTQEINRYFSKAPNWDNGAYIRVRGILEKGFISATEIRVYDPDSVPQVFTFADAHANEQEFVWEALGEAPYLFLDRTYARESLYFQQSNEITARDIRGYAKADALVTEKLAGWMQQEGDKTSGGGVLDMSGGNLAEVRMDFTYEIGDLGGHSYLLVAQAVGYPLRLAAQDLLLVYIIAFLGFGLLMAYSTFLFARAYQKQHALEEHRRMLTGAVAHELKTPLGIIRNYSEALKEHIAEEDRDAYVGTIIAETEVMDTLVRDMLLLSKLAAMQTPQFQKTKLEDVLQEQAAQYQKLAKANNVRVQVETALPKPLQVSCEPRLLSQAVSNLLSNAVRHTPQNGLVRVLLEQAPDSPWRVVVENEGEPISEDALLHIWDAFYKADTARAGEGSGLGLCIAKQIFQLHQWQYGVQNKQGGVRFWFSGQ